MEHPVATIFRIPGRLCDLSAWVQAGWVRDEVRPLDNAWVTEMYRESNDILKGIEKASDPSLKSSTQLPWNPRLDKKFLGV
mgnify:CR=1 FL=1